MESESPRCQRKTRNKIRKLTYTPNETRNKKKNTMVLKLSSTVSVECTKQGQIIPDSSPGAIQTTLFSEFPLSKLSLCSLGLTGRH